MKILPAWSYRFVLCGIVCCLTLVLRVYAQSQKVYAVDYKILQEIQGGTVLLEAAPDGRARFIHTKTKPYGLSEADVVSVWHGAGQENIRRVTLGGASVLESATATDGKIVLFLERDSTLLLGVMNHNLEILSETPIPAVITKGQDERLRYYSFGKRRTFCVLIGGKGYLCTIRPDSMSLIRAITMERIEDLVTLNPDTQNPEDPCFAYSVRSGFSTTVNVANEFGVVLYSYRIEKPQNIVLQRVNNYTVAACVEFASFSQITIMTKTGIWRDIVVPAKPRQIVVQQLPPGSPDNAAFAVLYSASDAGRYSWMRILVNHSGQILQGSQLAQLPENVFLPSLVFPYYGQQENVYVIVCANALITINEAGEIRSVNSLPMWILNNPGDGRITMQTISIDALTVLTVNRTHWVIQLQRHRFWWIRNIINAWWMYGLAFAGVLFSLLVLYRVRHQNRLLASLFGFPGADIMIILDAEGKLLTLNEPARKLLIMPNDVPMKRLFQFYCVGMSTNALAEFAVMALQARSTQTKKIVLERVAADSPESNTHPLEYLFSAHPIQSRLGASKGIILIGKDITEELEKKRLANWADLAHDMKTNLSSIRMNAELVEKQPHDKEQAIKLILFLVNKMQQRVLDLTEIGKSDEIKKQKVDAAELCLNVRKEFDDAHFGNVHFEIHAQHVDFECDQIKLERALRNAVENGIRANARTVRITSWAEPGVVCFQVQDTGEGMTEEVYKNMMKKGYTTFEGKGGSGMGTVIMNRIVDLHGGELNVHSEKGKGTTMVFRIPSPTIKKLSAKPLEMSGKNIFHH